MNNLVEKALAGKRLAMEQLYNTYSPGVFALGYYILGDEAAAKAMTKSVFLNVWEDLKGVANKSEEGFKYLVFKKAAELIRKKLLKDNRNAFKIPTDKNFDCRYNLQQSSNENLVLETLQSLNELNRFVMVLTFYGGFNKNQLAEATKLDLKTLQNLLDAAERNGKNAFGNLYPNKSYDEFKDALTKGEHLPEQDTSIPEEIKATINSIAEPKEKAVKKKAITGGLIGMAVAILAVLLTIVIITSVNDSKETGSNSSTSSVTAVENWVTKVAETTYYADIDIKDFGKITVALDGKTAPKTVENFVTLAKSGFYDGLTFHRIIEGFMMQGGDPEGTGFGGSENNIVGEFALNGYNNNLSHTRGAISMARSQEYNSGSSQFFICHKDSKESLDGNYAAFGYVTEGIEVVDKVCETVEVTDGNGSVEKENQPIINKITIREP